MERYKLTKEDINNIRQNVQNSNEQIGEIMNLIAKKRGAIISGGHIDEEKAAGIIIDDFRTGKMGRITLEKAN